jgi:translation initiation factor IF-3
MLCLHLHIPAMAVPSALRHSTRLLSPGETLLRALLPVCAPMSRRPLHTTQPRLKNSRVQAQRLPKDFSVADLLAFQRKPIHVQETHKLAAHDYILDEAIDSRWVQVKDAATKRFSKPQMLESVIATLDRRVDSVVLLSRDGLTPDTPMVEIRKRSELLEMAHSRTGKKKGGVKMKQIELNWAINGHDLDMKLRKILQILSKGDRVEILLANKKRQRKAEPHEAQATLKKVRDNLQEARAIERKMEGNVGQLVTLVVEPNPSKKTSPAAATASANTTPAATTHADNAHSSPPS